MREIQRNIKQTVVGISDTMLFLSIEATSVLLCSETKLLLGVSPSATARKVSMTLHRMFASGKSRL